jgi:hypothetical protein
MVSSKLVVSKSFQKRAPTDKQARFIEILNHTNHKIRSGIKNIVTSEKALLKEEFDLNE